MLNLKFKPTKINITLFVIGIIAAIIGYPLLAIWGINTLFPSLAIPYTIWTWSAVILVRGFFMEFMSFKKD